MVINSENDYPNSHGNGTNGHTKGYAYGHFNGHSNGVNGSSHTNGHDNSSSAGRKEVPVAICGMAMRLPGGIHNDAELYKFLFDGKDAKSIIPEDRYSVDTYYSPHGQDGTIVTKEGYFLGDLDYSNLDLSMFTFGAAEAEQMDPNHRLVLEVVREAFESAGESDWRGKNIGTYVGLFTEDWQEIAHKDNQEWNSHRIMGGTDFALPNRIAYEYDLRGPSMVIKTACSSAGIGLHEALESIREGKINSAMITGSNLILAPGLTILLSVLGSLSPEGSSKSFDASADGYARAEAVSALYVKRLDHAIRDGNPVRAVIRSSATNVDGKTNGITSPSGEAHEALIRQTYGAINLDMGATAMVEAHGTGTKVGDPIEVGAIGRCFPNDIYIGASKPNLGHSESCAALTSVMKATVSLENLTILPNIKFDNPNPRIPWDDLKLTVPLKPTPWPENKAERISVNSYGIGGSNVHFIIDSAASFGIKKSHAAPSAGLLAEKPQKKLLLFSANHEESLKRVAENIEGYLIAHPERTDDTAYTLANRREHLKFRNFSIFQGASEPFEVSARTKHSGPTKAAFVFTGQGAQWVHMGRELMYDYPIFLENIRRSDKVLQSLRHAPSFSIEDILINSDDKNLLQQAEYSQPFCTALQVALVDLLATWSITPSAVVGHSSGELGAAYAAGALSAKDAMIAAFYRGFVCKTAQRNGGMAAVGLGKEAVTPYLLPKVRVACENSGSSVTLSGDLDSLDQVIAKIKEAEPDVFARKLQVEMAYHSQHMTLVGDDYRDFIAEHLTPRTPKIPFYSSVKSKVLTRASDFGPKYWQDNLENPVLFHSATRLLLANSKECGVHLEVGPHAALAGPLRQTYKEASQTINYVSVLSRGKDDTVSFLQAVGTLHSNGVKISYPVGSEEVVSDLPSYPWHYEKPYWSETRVQKNWRFRKYLPHDLLGLRILEGSDVAPSWRNVLRTVDVPWLNDHCIGNDTIFPAAGYIAIAGEAAYQISGVRDYTVRDVEISKAFLLYNDKAVEVVTNLQPHNFTSNSSETDWYTFQIVSYDGSSWNKHCSGLVRSGRVSPFPAERTQSLDRKVSSSRWYTTMSRVGLNYTGKFSKLDNINASVTEPIASADLLDRQDVTESSYMIHPSTLDMVFQSLTVARTKGIYRDFNKLFLPTFIEELYVGDGRNKAIQINTASPRRSDTVQGESYGVANGKIVFSLKGFRGKSMSNSADTAPPLNTLQLQWKPHLEFLKASDLMHTKSDMRGVIQLYERLTVLCVIETRNAINGLKAAQPHFEKFRNWVNSEYERYQKPGYPLVEDSADLVKLSIAERKELIEEVFKQCDAAGGWTIATALYRNYINAAEVFEGKSSMLDILLQDGVLIGMYQWMNDIWDFTNYVQLLGHIQPQMKILEIGAGTGGLTNKFLSDLKSDYDERLYYKYTFTDVSSGFFVQAQERFKDYVGIEYQALDISQDPLEQGFKADEYDLIIASNVLHATPNLHDTLSNVRTLLKPEGQLFLQEISPVTQTMSYSIGTFEGWWLAEEDGRPDHPYISPEEWDKRLKDAGFAGCDSVTTDYEQPYMWMANIIAKPAVQHSIAQKVTLLHGSQKTPFMIEIENILLERGVESEPCEWGVQEPIEDQDIISFLDLGEKPLLQDIEEPDLTRLIKSFNTYQQSNIVWLTPSAQIHPTNPYAGQILGLLRTVRSEIAASFATLELADTKEGAAGAVADVLTKVQRSRDADDELDIDMEWAWTNGALNVGRFHWIPVNKDLSNTVGAPVSTGLTIRTLGLLQTLEWTSQPLEDVAPEEVHIKISAAGLNHNDILLATDTAANGTFGLEGVGVITKIGSKVTNVAVGDRVITVGAESVGLATVILRSSQLVIKIPDQFTNEEAATMPLVYITVLMFLVQKWKLSKGQSILIHSAAGEIGIAAINVAKWLGATIYATVGTDEKVEFLTKEFGIPRSRIFSSRDTGFYEGILEATNGTGVDLVLNTLSGDLLSASWKTVARDGALIDIGKLDTVGKGQLTLARHNQTYLRGDAALYIATHKSEVSQLLELLVDQYTKGIFKPITPVSTFDAAKVEDAFKYLQQGLHTGKVVIKFPQEDTLPLAPTVPLPNFRGDATYVLVGGLGGLGKGIAGWMASYGAKNLMFLSRSAGKSAEDKVFAKELNLMGCSTQLIAVDIANAGAVKNAVSQATLPIAGALQMAMVLDDRGISDMDLKSWNNAITPKVQGAWNLHNFLPKELDFFVLFSSSSGTHGFYGQSNYASANTFLDAFAQYRQSQGLAASVMNIGPIDDIGFVSQNNSTKETLAFKVGNLLWETSFLDTLQLAIARSSTKYAPQPTSIEQIYSGFKALNHIFHPPEGSGQVQDAETSFIWKRDVRLAIYRNLQKVSTVSSSGSRNQLKQFISSMAKDPIKLDQKSSSDVITKELSYCVSNFLMIGDEEIDISLSLSDAGVDSLVAIEIRNWWKQNLGTDVSVLELLGGGSIEQLGTMAAQRLKSKYASD